MELVKQWPPRVPDQISSVTWAPINCGIGKIFHIMRPIADNFTTKINPFIIYACTKQITIKKIKKIKGPLSLVMKYIWLSEAFILCFNPWLIKHDVVQNAEQTFSPLSNRSQWWLSMHEAIILSFTVTILCSNFICQIVSHRQNAILILIYDYWHF